MCLIIIFLYPLILIFTGCISSRSHAVGVEANAKYMASPYYEVLGDAEGMSSSFTLFWLFPVTPSAGNDEAVDDAIKSRGGDNLIEAVFTRESKVYIIGTVSNIYVKGKVIRYLQRSNNDSGLKGR
ncbi:MAG TPA: hypothetical protein PKG60_08520 [Spirochaetota bacterium]|nr:hypothetical protein [Spirochaetota bacterium]HPS87524.1 hypothetical protein [Spirochaetota bacterium]